LGKKKLYGSHSRALIPALTKKKLAWTHSGKKRQGLVGSKRETSREMHAAEGEKSVPEPH